MIQIYEDTRQQQAHGDKHANKHAWWTSHGIEVERLKLEFGDYIRADGSSNIAVDTKRSLDEVAGNVGREHERFVRELERAREAGWRLVILIEAGGRYKDLQDVNGWVNGACQRCQYYKMKSCKPHGAPACKRYRRKPMQGVQLYKIMRTLERKHGCIFEVCPPSKAAQRICDLLGVGYE